MPTQKKKLKKVKPDPLATTVVPVQIKAEPLDIKPLSAFVEDRVELIRQAFSCLKPKEVKCLVPDFLQGKSIESLQESCLDELLGISTKRLLAILNNTKCPTDTESSSDEDEKIVEHISLDEISSDSDVEIAKPIAKKVKSKDVKSKKVKEPGEKEMTVLELLELQARARAIRSQLALEPVTKIELDSDQDGDNVSDPGKIIEQLNSGNTKAVGNNNTKKSPPKEQSKRVRLKRNFRIRQVGDEDFPEEVSQSSIPEPQPERKSRSQSKEKEEEIKPLVHQQTKQDEETKESKSRDSSPEVIPVIPSPETLCISSDSEDEKARKVKSSIFVDNIEELEKQIKEKQAQSSLTKSDHKDEPEEGELTEEDKSPKRCRKDSVKSNAANNEKTPIESPKEMKGLDLEEELDYEVREVSDSEPDASNPGNNDSTKTETEGVGNEPREENDSGESEPECDSTDDDTKNKSSSEADDDHDPDIVEIHDSSDETLLEQKLAEDETEKSWGSRWLESKRVAKVMAASRLGNKVRDKLKKKKQKEQKQQELEKEASKEQSPEPPKEPEIAPNVEVGSVEHYKELVANAGASVSKEKDRADAVANNAE
ncbi:DNA ligase 1 isoform X2 [Armigeres subalbatus]|uniref:DNA ligase 1 isoform X2 n=1 Tax=Armigeres subalbatus TaxID=124917 RepID=UPI002ED235A1